MNWRTRRKLHKLAVWALALLCIAAIVLTILVLHWHKVMRQDECTARGGKVVEMQSSRDNAWFCDEPR